MNSVIALIRGCGKASLWASICLGAGLCGSAWAQTFKMPCEVEGTIPSLDDRKLDAAKVVVEIQSLGKNVFLKINGPKLYQVQVTSLTTEEFDGKNLTTAKEMGAYKKHRKTGLESEVRLQREPIMLHAFHDVSYNGKITRVHVDGPCTYSP
jgi:hypothetical protein